MQPRIFQKEFNRKAGFRVTLLEPFMKARSVSSFRSSGFGTRVRETLFRESRETEFRGSAFPIGVWERGHEADAVCSFVDFSFEISSAPAP